MKKLRGLHLPQSVNLRQFDMGCRLTVGTDKHTSITSKMYEYELLAAEAPK